MATATIIRQAICAGGDHVTLRLTVGANTFDFMYDVTDLSLPITAEQRKEAVSVITRFHTGGMTKAQVRTAVQNGITVTTAS